MTEKPVIIMYFRDDFQSAKKLNHLIFLNQKSSSYVHQLTKEILLTIFNDG